jgi:hypothetical protein
MSLWGTTTAASDKPKFLPIDKNAAGSTGSREHAIAVAGGWGLSPGLAASGNDNMDAMPEVLVCVKNLATFMGGASVIGMDWTDATVGNVGTFDITITFDEAVDVTSAAWSANQTVTNKAYILLSRMGQTDMVEDNTMACMYYSGSGSNQIVFRGTAQTNAAAGYLGFNSAGVGDDDVITGIIFNGSAALDDEDGASAIGIRQESGTASAGTAGDSIIADGSAAASVTVNGALTQSTTLVIDGLSGAALAVGQVVTVNGAGSSPAASITDADGNTGISTDNSLTITAVANVTTCTVSESITVADNIVLLTSTNGGDEMVSNGISMTVAGPSYASSADLTLVARVGETLGGDILLEDGSQDTGRDTLVLDATGSSSENENDQIDLEDKTSGIATYVQAGTTDGTAYVLNGITVAAA